MTTDTTSEGGRDAVFMATRWKRAVLVRHHQPVDYTHYQMSSAESVSQRPVMNVEGRRRKAECRLSVEDKHFSVPGCNFHGVPIFMAFHAPVVHDWVNKGLGRSSRFEKSRTFCPGGRFPPSFIPQVIIITGLNKLYDCMFSPLRWP